MSDLVERLRVWPAAYGEDAMSSTYVGGLAKRAADEILQLRAQVERLTACAKFVVWAVNDGPWQGGDLDGLSIQEKAEELGLIAETKFDPAIHKASDWV